MVAAMKLLPYSQNQTKLFSLSQLMRLQNCYILSTAARIIGYTNAIF